MDRTVGGLREGFQLTIKADGNYLIIYPEREGSALIDLGTLRKRLEDEGVTDYDVLQLARLVRAADGVEERLELPADDGEENTVIPFRIEISRDGMTAAVRFDDKRGNLPPTVSDVLDALAARKVVYGIDREAIGRGVARLTPFFAARGTERMPASKRNSIWDPRGGLPSVPLTAWTIRI